MRRTGEGGAGDEERQRERKAGRAQAGVEGERTGGCKTDPPIGEDEAPSDPLPKAIGAGERREGVTWTSRPKTGRPDVLPVSPPGNQALHAGAPAPPPASFSRPVSHRFRPAPPARRPLPVGRGRAHIGGPPVSSDRS